MLLVLVSFLYCFHLLCVFYDIGSDGMVALWERAANSVYNIFSVPCEEKIIVVVVVVLGFYVSQTAKVIRRRDLGLKSHPKDWRSPGSNSRPLD